MIILRMVINVNEERLGTLEQIEQFLSASAAIEFSAAGNDGERYGHISRVLKRFDCPRRNKRERGGLGLGIAACSVCEHGGPLSGGTHFF